MSIFNAIKKATSSIGEVFDPISGIASAAAGYLGQQSANEANSAQAAKQMDFQEKMRKTQYQTSMIDMRKAGLNPILAYKTGGAGTPSGTSAIMQNTANSAIDAMSKTRDASSRSRTSKADKSLKRTQENTEWQKAEVFNNQIDQIASQSKLNSQNATLAYQKYLTERENTNSAFMSNQAKKSFLRAIKKSGDIKSANKWLQYLDIGTESIGKALGSGNSAKQLFK